MWKTPQGEAASLPAQYRHKQPGTLVRMGVRRISEANAPDGVWWASTGHTDQDSATEPVTVRTHDLAPAMTVDQARARLVRRAKAEAGRRIEASGHDRYAARLVGYGTPIPQALVDYREAVVARCDAIEAELADIEDYAELAAYEPGGWPEEV